MSRQKGDFTKGLLVTVFPVTYFAVALGNISGEFHVDLFLWIHQVQDADFTPIGGFAYVFMEMCLVIVIYQDVSV